MTRRPRAKSVVAKILPLFMLLLRAGSFSPRRFCGLFSTFHSAATFSRVLSGGALVRVVRHRVGTFIATYTKSAQQAQLMAFFVNPPLSSLSVR